MQRIQREWIWNKKVTWMIFGFADDMVSTSDSLVSISWRDKWWELFWNEKGDKIKSNPLVFVHGVGGLGFYYQLINDIVKESSNENVPIILLDLPHVSLRIQDDIPEIALQVKSVCKILDETVGKQAATFVGHSFGSILLSWYITIFL